MAVAMPTMATIMVTMARSVLCGDRRWRRMEAHARRGNLLRPIVHGGKGAVIDHLDVLTITAVIRKLVRSLDLIPVLLVVDSRNAGAITLHEPTGRSQHIRIFALCWPLSAHIGMTECIGPYHLSPASICTYRPFNLYI